MIEQLTKERGAPILFVRATPGSDEAEVRKGKCGKPCRSTRTQGIVPRGNRWKGRSFLCMSLPKSDELVKQLNNQVVTVCRALFGRDPDLHSPDPSLIQYGDILIHIEGRRGSWITGIDPKTNTRQQGNDQLDLIQFQNQMTEPEALAWVRSKGLLDPPPAPKKPEPDAGDGGAKPGNGEKTRFIEQVTEPGKSIIGTNTNPFWKWKSPWYEQVAIQAVQSIHLATVLGMVGHNTTGESYYSYEELGRLMGKTGKTAYRQMRRLIKNGNVEIIEQGGLVGDLKKSNRIRTVLKTGQPQTLEVLLGRKAKVPKTKHRTPQCG